VLHFFYSPTCVHCHPIQSLLTRTKNAHPSFIWEAHPLTEPANIELMTQFYLQYEVPEEQWSGTLAVFYGDKWWVDGDRALAELGGSVRSGTSQGVDAAPRTRPDSVQALSRAFEGFSMLTVAGAGLIDGINPCALATVVFLLSYLGLTRRDRGQVLAVGLAFAAGVFLAYLAVGMGALRAIGTLQQLSWASRLVYPALAALTLSLAVASIVDYRTAAGGSSRGMRLKLPRRLSLASHGVVRRLADARGIVVVAFAAGAVISVLELFCTGQIYLPTLMYMWSAGPVRAKVLTYLVLYVAMFTLPIVLLTGATYAGASTEVIARMVRERLAAVKLATAGLFAVLGAYLTVVSLRVFGVY
jgi:cytochrome c biogenesis protein CcdA